MRFTQRLRYWKVLKVVFFYCVLTLPVNLSAQPVNFDFIKLQSAKVATIVMIPPEWSTNPMDEDEFKRFGCSFSTVMQSSISNLIKVLENVKIQNLVESNYKKTSSMSGIYFTYQNGDEIKLLFAPSKNEIQILKTDSKILYEVKNANGEFTQTRKVKRTYLKAENSLYDSLFKFAAEEKLVIHGWKEMIESCEREVSKYRKQ